MPIIGLVRFFTTLVSLTILAAAGYLIWRWTTGEVVPGPAGDLVRVRADWRLWTGLALLGVSMLGRPVVLLLLAKKNGSASRPERENGDTVMGPSGSCLYVERHGPPTAPMIIFTHGWGMDSTIWHESKLNLSDRFRLVLWDLPGLGRSQLPPKKRVDLRHFAADLASLLPAGPGEKAVLVGHSIGGMTIQTLVRDYPQALDRVAGIVLLNTTYTNPLQTIVLGPLLRAIRRPILEPAMRLVIWLQPLVWLSQWQSYLSGSAHIAHRLGFGRFVTRSQLDHATLLTTRNPPGVQMHGNLAMFRWDASDALKGCPVPVLVVGGELDIVTKLEASTYIASETSGARLVTIKGVNHMGPVERADEYNRLIADFANSVQPEPTAARLA